MDFFVFPTYILGTTLSSSTEATNSPLRWLLCNIGESLCLDRSQNVTGELDHEVEKKKQTGK
jgi:hypothetical protein